jgi:hypothetical protein
MGERAKNRFVAANGNGKHTIVKLTREEILTSLEEGARQRCRMSARKLLRKHRENRLRDPGAVADLLALSYLLKKDDPIFAEN